MNGTQQNSEINPGIYGQLIYNKRANDTQWERTVSNKWC